MSIETLLGFGSELTTKLKQSIPLIENCMAYYRMTQHQGLIFDNREFDSLKERRHSRQEEIKKLYRERGKIVHGQSGSPYESQYDYEKWAKFHEKMSNIESESRQVLRNLILGILALGRIPTPKELEKAVIDGFLLRTNHDQMMADAERLD